MISFQIKKIKKKGENLSGPNHLLPCDLNMSGISEKMGFSFLSQFGIEHEINHPILETNSS